MSVRRQLTLLTALLVACAASPPRRPSPEPVARAVSPKLAPSAALWSAAALRFHSGGAWLGGDGAYSIDLGPERVLWLFADTFIDPLADGSRVNGPNDFIHNSVAIQSGPDRASAHDLSRASLSFSWGRTSAGKNASFFRDIDGASRWIWPLHGARLADGRLLVFRMEIVASPSGFGFAVDSWDAIAIDDPDAAAEIWQPRPVATANHAFGKMIGSSVLIDDGYLYAYAVNVGGDDHSVFLARWPTAAISGIPSGALDDPEWFSAGSFVRASALDDGQPSPLFADGQTEFSVHYEAPRDRFVEIQMKGLFVSDPNTQISLRSAPRPEGPWSNLTPFYRPAESQQPGAANWAAYAAKAHPEQLGADEVLTYVVNDVKNFPPADSIYYPQPLRLSYRPAADGGSDSGE